MHGNLAGNFAFSAPAYPADPLADLYVDFLLEMGLHKEPSLKSDKIGNVVVNQPYKALITAFEMAPKYTPVAVGATERKWAALSDVTTGEGLGWACIAEVFRPDEKVLLKQVFALTSATPLPISATALPNAQAVLTQEVQAVIEASNKMASTTPKAAVIAGEVGTSADLSQGAMVALGLIGAAALYLLLKKR